MSWFQLEALRYVQQPPPAAVMSCSPARLTQKTVYLGRTRRCGSTLHGPSWLPCKSEGTVHPCTLHSYAQLTLGRTRGGAGADGFGQTARCTAARFLPPVPHDLWRLEAAAGAADGASARGATAGAAAGAACCDPRGPTARCGAACGGPAATRSSPGSSTSATMAEAMPRPASMPKRS